MDLKLKDNNQLTFPIVNKVEYIETSGNVNINTGVTIDYRASYSYIIKATIQVIENNTTNAAIYMSQDAVAIKLISDGTSTTNFKCYYGNYANGNTGAPVDISLNGKVKIEQKAVNTEGSSYFKVNDNTTSLPRKTAYNRAGTLYLLQGDIKVRIWNWEIYQNDILLRKYIPTKSIEKNHIGEAALYDLVNNKYYYPASTGTFTASHPQGLYDVLTSAYVKDCPNIDGITILRNALNLNRIRCNINNSTGHVAELYKYAQLSGFNDAGEQQTKPRIVGTFNIDDYYTDAEAAEIRSKIDGITVTTLTASDYNIDTLLDNDSFAVQTFDSTKQGYNPAAAIILQSGDLGITSVLPLNDGGRFGFLKNDSTTTLPAIFRDKTTVVDSNKIVSNDDTEEYAFTSFDEFKEMTNITSIAADTFRGASNLTSIKLPNTVTSVGNSAFRMCTSLKDLYIPCDINLSALSGNENVSDYSGDGTGTLTINGNIPGGGSWGAIINFRDIIVYGNVFCGNARIVRPRSRANSFRVKGNMTLNASSNVCIFNGTGNTVGAFTEVMGDISCNKALFSNNYYSNTVTVFHCGYNQMVTATPTQMSIAKIAKVYVGQGISKSDDETLLATYIADTNWSAQSAKLATWYDYNGEYKWYYITDNLTNCTNTNPDAWPHITRGEEYRTTIVADEGYTLGTVKVEMYSARDNSLTPDEPTDITSAVYNASTGEIYIQEVVGNVIITANAS